MCCYGNGKYAYIILCNKWLISALKSTSELLPGNTYHVNDVRLTRAGRRGVLRDCKYGRNKPESEFPTGQAEYSLSCERLGSCCRALDDEV